HASQCLSVDATATTEIYTLSLHDALPISVTEGAEARVRGASLAEPDLIAELQAKSVRVALLVIDACRDNPFPRAAGRSIGNTRRSEEHTSELQSRGHLVCRLLLEKKKDKQ